MGGWKAVRAVLPAVVVCGVAFAGTQFIVSNFFGPYLTDILGSLLAIVCLVALLNFWRPRGIEAPPGHRHSARRGDLGLDAVRAAGDLRVAVGHRRSEAIAQPGHPHFPWPDLHNQILRVPPAVGKASPYAAVYTFNCLSAAGTSCFFAAICAALLLRVSVGHFLRILGATVKQLFFSEVTIATVLALAYLMNYSGATATLGLAFAATGALFPFFSALLGWLGVFLTGSDTSSNALFGPLQVVTATKLHLNPGADGRGQFERRRHGQDDQPAKHRGRRGRHAHAARGRSQAVSLHVAAQHLSGVRHWRGRCVLCVRRARLGKLSGRTLAIAQSWPIWSNPSC